MTSEPKVLSLEDAYDAACRMKAEGFAEEAEQILRAILKVKPSDAESLRKLGEILGESGRYQEAISVLRHANALEPSHAGGRCVLGSLYGAIGDYAASGREYERALALSPDMPSAHWNYALWRLQQGDFNAWQEYRWGVVNRQRRLRTLAPEWNGDRVDTLFVWAEQGLGDTIQFLQILPLVNARVRRTVLECQSGLISLLYEHPFTDDVIVQQVDGGMPAPYDAHCSLMSLPAILSLTEAHLPVTQNYIEADSDYAQIWSRRMEKGFRVGLCWAGNAGHTNDRNRSLPLEAFIPLSGVPGVRFYGVQKGEAAKQVNVMPLSFSVKSLDTDLKDFRDTAAALVNMDLVITCDTVIAHLAGAMGIPCWILLPVASDFRWMLDREESPWYPCVRLFRQRTPGDWGEVIQRVKGALCERVTTD